MEEAVVQLDTCTFESPQRDSAGFRWRVAVTSNHLDISSVWKSLVASSVCVDEVGTRVFNVFISSIKAFVFSAKCIRLQHQKCLALSTKPVCG